MCQDKIQTETGPTVTLGLYSVNVIAIIGAGSIRVDIVELNVIVSFSTKLDGLVDLDRLGELAVGLQVPRLVCRVLQDHVGLSVLVVPEANEDNVRLIDPDLFPEFPPDVAKPLDTIEAHRLEASVTKHLGHLSVLLPILLEDQLSLQPLVLVLPPPPVLSSLSLVLRHCSNVGFFRH